MSHLQHRLFIIVAIILCPFFTFSQNTIEEIRKTNLVIGETVEIYSKILNENRILNIYLPNGYSPDSSKNYPVIYLLDGAYDEDFIHISGLVQFGSFSWINFIPESIVVGIANVDRKRDFTYNSKNNLDQKEFPTSGKSGVFMNFLENELQEYIKAKYKTNDSKTIIGQSLGGLLATEILFKRPYMFDNYIIISPSLWWDDKSLLKYEPLTYSSKKSIYVGVGKEGKIMEKTARKLYEKIHNMKSKNKRVFFNYFEEQSHGDALHLSTYDAFTKIFSEPKI